MRHRAKRVNAALKRARDVDSLCAENTDAGTYDATVHYSAEQVRPHCLLPRLSAGSCVWWDSLSDKQWMIEQHPDVIGNLEGVDIRRAIRRTDAPRLQKQAKEGAGRITCEGGPPRRWPKNLRIRSLSARVKALDEGGGTLKQVRRCSSLHCLQRPRRTKYPCCGLAK